MRSMITRMLVGLGCALMVSILASPSIGGMILTVDSDAGTLSIDGAAWAASVQWRGVTIAAGGIADDGAREYFVHGDFNVEQFDTVTAVLGDSLDAQHPVRFIVGNNAYLAGTFDVSASGTLHRGGGGLGGDVGLGAAGGTGGGLGGDGGNRGRGGPTGASNTGSGGGTGGMATTLGGGGEAGWDGGSGGRSDDGGRGDNGAVGAMGRLGGDAFASGGTGGVQAFGGAGGDAGDGGRGRGLGDTCEGGKGGGGGAGGGYGASGKAGQPGERPFGWGASWPGYKGDDGSDGGGGGSGGSGGGAMEIRIMGRAVLGAAAFSARGGSGAAGQTGASGVVGLDGWDGEEGHAGYPGKAGDADNRVAKPALGGAGGTIKIVASVVTQTGNFSVDAGGGDSDGMAGADGRFVLGRNAGADFAGTLTGGTLIDSTADGQRYDGPRALNPYVAGWATDTPFIPDLVGGADSFGMTALAADGPELEAVLANAPANAMAALCLMDEGPLSLGQDWDGFDMLLYVNLTDDPLAFPAVGVGAPGLLISLAEGGFERRAQFGGAGYEYLDALAARGVYVMLVPEGATSFSMLAGDGEFTYRQTLGAGEAMYMVPEPATLSLLAIGGAALLRRRQRRN